MLPFITNVLKFLLLTDEISGLTWVFPRDLVRSCLIPPGVFQLPLMSSNGVQLPPFPGKRNYEFNINIFQVSKLEEIEKNTKE